MTHDKPMDESDITRISLEYFTNPAYQDELEAQRHKSNSNRIRDIRFYRRRISELTKCLLKGNSIEGTIQSYFDGYVDAAIAHFKMIDRKDILQKEYIEINEEVDQYYNNQSNEQSVIEKSTIRDANLDLVKLPVVPSTLDSFVVSSKPNNISNDAPQIRNIDLRDPQLRTKGVKSKKKRVKNKLPHQDDKN